MKPSPRVPPKQHLMGYGPGDQVPVFFDGGAVIGLADRLTATGQLWVRIKRVPSGEYKLRFTPSGRLLGVTSDWSHPNTMIVPKNGAGLRFQARMRSVEVHNFGLALHSELRRLSLLPIDEPKQRSE